MEHKTEELLGRSEDNCQTVKLPNIEEGLFLPHSAPSWILGKAENLASFSLQDGATT